MDLTPDAARSANGSMPSRGRSSLIRQSTFTSVAAAASIGSGLLLDVAIAAVFGAGAQTDSFFVAARLPLGLIAIVMVGANQALVPTFTTWLVQRGERETWRLVSLTLTASVLITVLLCAAMAAVALPAIWATAPGLTGQQLRLAASLTRLIVLIVPLVTAAEVLRSLLNARGIVVAPAAMHLALNGTAATFIVLLREHGVYAIAWGYLAGSLVQLVILSALSHRAGFRFRPSLGFGDPELVSLARLASRPLSAAGLNPLARVGEQLFVSFLPPGSITILNYGYRLISAIGGAVFFRSVMVTLLPRLTTAAALDDSTEVRHLTRLGVRLMLAISVPLTGFVAVLASPAVRALFGRGSFGREETTALGLVFAVYAASLVGSGLQRAFLAPFLARLDTRTPFRNTVYGVVANLVLVPLLLLPAHRHGTLALLAVPAAYSIAQYVNVGHAWSRLRLLGRPPLEGIGGLTWRLSICTAASASAMSVAHDLLPWQGGTGFLLLNQTILVAGIGAAALVCALLLLGGDEWRSIRAAFGIGSTVTRPHGEAALASSAAPVRPSVPGRGRS